MWPSFVKFIQFTQVKIYNKEEDSEGDMGRACPWTVYTYMSSVYLFYNLLALLYWHYFVIGAEEKQKMKGSFFLRKLR